MTSRKAKKKASPPFDPLAHWSDLAAGMVRMVPGVDPRPFQSMNPFDILNYWSDITAGMARTAVGLNAQPFPAAKPFDALAYWSDLAAKMTPAASSPTLNPFPNLDPSAAFAFWSDLTSRLTQSSPGAGPCTYETSSQPEAIASWSGVTSQMSQLTWDRFTRDAVEYWTDFWQRSILFLDTMRQRGNNMLEHYESGMPPLLDYEYEVVMDARELERPANYSLLYIKHPEGKQPAPGRRPLVIIDPRAGHGPGIGGFKRDSQVGMGLLEGHPVYFVSFIPEPCPGQTLEDVELAETRFMEEIRGRHPDRDFPLVYGNCQAGWAVAMLGADRPDVTGPIVINGAPMSFWAGAEGVNPMRLSGGITGGAWATRFMCDLGCGIFDGVYLVQNFENLNPANTLWKKDYNLFANIDREQQRYLDFEKWWTGFYLMNEEEILWIVGDLFLGNKLEQGVLEIGPGHKIDMKSMEDPLVVFASSGDNITPPQQALQWISEVYRTTEELKKAGQRIIYMINPHVGHLGIFVSASVARREHRAIIEHIEQMENLEPGLYQMFIDGETGETDPLEYQFIVRFEEREIDDVRFPLSREAFEKMTRVSEANEKLYLAFGRPLMRALISHPLQGQILRWMNPARVSRYIWSDRLMPWMKGFEPLAEWVKQNRRPSDENNTFRYAERRLSDNIVTALDAFRDSRDSVLELFFEAMYR